MTSHVDRFYAAVSVLAGDGHIKQRLTRAYQDNLADIEDNELPDELKKSFLDLRDKLHQVTPLKGEGPICASVRKMSACEASECATEVVSLYGEIIRCGSPLSDVVPLKDQEQEPVPPFLVQSVS